MNESEPTPPNKASYSVSVFGTTHSYSLSDGIVRYGFSNSHAEFCLDLHKHKPTLIRGRQFHRRFYRGITALGGAILLSFEITFIKQESLLAFPSILILPPFLLYGLYSILRSWQPVRCWRIRTPAGDQLSVLEDRNNPDACATFIENIRNA